jgi:uncharacterized protein (DUF58 family)
VIPASAKCSLPEVVQKIGRLELRARSIVEGFLSGAHRSPYFGQSVEFREHRPYVTGDDLRYVDWKVWGKQDRLVVKRFEEDTNLRCTLLVDVSASMAYGRGPLNKHAYAATAAVAIAYLILRQHDAVGCIAFDDAIRRQVPMRTKRGQLSAITSAVLQPPTVAKTDVSAVLRKVASSVPRRGVIVLISDLLGDIDALLPGLQLLLKNGHDLLVFHVLDDEELDFPFEGPTRFEGLESIEELQCDPRALRRGYLESLNKYLADLSRVCRTNRIDYTLTRTSTPFNEILARVLAHRRFTQRSHR